jgi:DNA-binding FrmR family transcriptional regulator
MEYNENAPRHGWGGIIFIDYEGKTITTFINNMLEAVSMDCADKKNVMNLLKTSKGQIDGIIKMLDEDRYCVDVSKQILSVQALLKKANLKIIDQHIKHCVKQAFTDGNGDEKVNEIIELIDKYAK